MSGYTKGVAKALSQKSMTTGLDAERLEVDPVHERENLETILADYCIEPEEADTLLQGETVYSDDGGTIDYDQGHHVVWIELNQLDRFNDLCPGELVFMTDQDHTVLGVRMGVAGEHMGQTSVWLDTYKGVLEQDGETYPLSDHDIDWINDTAEEIYND